MNLIDRLIQDGWLKSPRIIKAFRTVKREDFLPDDLKDSAETDCALPIGFGQTISQPLTVAFMLELLRPEPGNKVLDIGSGSGWTSALLGEIVGEEGRVTALEVIPELKELGRKNASKYNKGRIRFVLADASKGFEEEAPYDRILCSAALEKSLPAIWREQLNIGGMIVAPIRSSIWSFVKRGEDDFEAKEFPGFAFVPFMEK